MMCLILFFELFKGLGPFHLTMLLIDQLHAHLSWYRMPWLRYLLNLLLASLRHGLL